MGDATSLVRPFHFRRTIDLVVAFAAVYRAATSRVLLGLAPVDEMYCQPGAGKPAIISFRKGYRQLVFVQIGHFREVGP